jgi:rhodanese-related sulfurtransferase
VHPNNHAGYYPGAKKVALKVLFDPETGLILGAQGYGDDGVDKRIDVISTAMMGKLTVDDLMDLELAYAPQYGSAKDAVNIVGYVGNNVLAGLTPTIQWHELNQAVAAGAQLLDVRSHSEFGNGHIPNSINIPVEDLRNRLEEVTKSNVIVYCQVGQRGHVATQILKAQGASVRNLDGGYVTWVQGQLAETLSQ